MSIILLRKLTLKSIIGFGEFKYLSVQNLIDTNKHSILIKMYYTCDAIDFNDDVKNILKINEERKIGKPGKNWDYYKRFIWLIIDEIIAETKIFEKDGHEKWELYNIKKRKRKQNSAILKIRNARECSKIRNRNRIIGPR